MSDFGKFFGVTGKPYTGAYHPSVYAKYSRGGGSENAVGTLGKAFAYNRPVFSDGGAADDSDSDISLIQAAAQPLPPRRPGQVEGMMQAINQWGQGPSGISQRFGNAGLYDIQRASYQLQQSVDSDTADKIQKYTDKIGDRVASADPDTPGLPSIKQRAEGGHVVSNFRKPLRNATNNDPYSKSVPARGGADYCEGRQSHSSGERSPLCSRTQHAKGTQNPCTSQRRRLGHAHSLERPGAARNQLRSRRWVHRWSR